MERLKEIEKQIEELKLEQNRLQEEKKKKIESEKVTRLNEIKQKEKELLELNNSFFKDYGHRNLNRSYYYDCLCDVDSVLKAFNFNDTRKRD